MNEPTHELEAYFAGEYTQEQFRAIEAWIHSDPANAKAFMAEVHFRELVGQRIREQRNETGAVLAELAQLEAAAQADTVTLLGELPEHDDPGSLSANDFAVVGKYILHRALANKRFMYAGVSAAAAAVLLLALIVINPFASQTPAPIANLPGPDNATPQRVELAPAVATLTASQDAQWSVPGGTLAPTPGDALRSGQRLTLTDGHAQITTNRQATLLIQAPCTIELVDNPNTIRLISGKLVGYVGNETAKGLLVRTPHMDVTDLGTRFGLACDANTTSLRVFEGEVLAAAPGNNAVQRTVKASESVRINANSTTIQPIETQPDRFVTTLAALADQPVLTGDIRYEASIPSDLRIGKYENSPIMLFIERFGVSLTEPIAVNLIEPGRYEGDALQQPQTLATATVDSYLVHLDTPLIPGAGSLRTATIHFDRPIVGVLTSSQAMADSHQALGLPDVIYGSMGEGSRFSGLDQLANDQPESVEISQDRRTLTVQISTGEGIDQFRVLIQSQTSP